MKKYLILLASILFCFVIGFIGSRFQTEAITIWYPTLNKSVLTPPNIVFPIVWSLLYICIGLSLGLVICSKNVNNYLFIGLFAIQIILNFTWSISFFYLQNPVLGLINIILLEIFIILYTIYTYSSVKLSSLLFIPYLLWVGFAGYLNLYIVLHN